jgi:hypothetical protein
MLMHIVIGKASYRPTEKHLMADQTSLPCMTSDYSMHYADVSRSRFMCKKVLISQTA